MVSFVAADGFQMVATSTDETCRVQLQGLLDRFTFLNSLDENHSMRTATLGVDGEVLFFVSEPNDRGDVKISKINPERIAGIIEDELDCELMKEVEFNKELTIKENGTTTKVKTLPIVNRNEEGQFEGRVHLLQINKLSGQTRGFSDFLPAIDTMDDFAKLFKTEIERVHMQKALVYDVEIDGDPDDEKVIALAEQIEEDGPPEAGDINVHSKNVKWTAQAPNMYLQDSCEFLKFCLTYNCGTLNMPPHWFSEGGDVNKATASEMGTPVWAFIRDRKRVIIAFYRQIVRHALWISRHIHQIPEEQLTFSIVSRDADPAAYNLIGKGLTEFLTTLVASVQAKFSSQMEARRIWRNCLQGLGLGQLLDPIDTSEPGEGAGNEVELQPPTPERIQEALHDYLSVTNIDTQLRLQESAYALAFEKQVAGGTARRSTADNPEY